MCCCSWALRLRTEQVLPRPVFLGHSPAPACGGTRPVSTGRGLTPSRTVAKANERQGTSTSAGLQGVSGDAHSSVGIPMTDVAFSALPWIDFAEMKFFFTVDSKSLRRLRAVPDISHRVRQSGQGCSLQPQCTAFHARFEGNVGLCNACLSIEDRHQQSHYKHALGPTGTHSRVTDEAPWACQMSSDLGMVTHKDGDRRWSIPPWSSQHSTRPKRGRRPQSPICNFQSPFQILQRSSVRNSFCNRHLQK